MVLCLAAIAIRYYSTAGRFLDQDEIYFFHVSHAVSRGAQLYSSLTPYYPPLLFYIGAAFFAVFRDLYAGLLGARIFVITCALAGFFFLFDLFRRLRLTWFIVPVTLFVLLLTQFDLKLMEFRGDNIVCPIVIAQAWLLFQLNEGTERAHLKRLAIVLLGLLTLHLNQKAAPIEAAVFIAFAATQFEALRGLVRRHWRTLSVGVLFVGGLVMWSSSYRLFLQQTYADMPHMMALYSLGGGWTFLAACMKRNPGFWMLSMLSVLWLTQGLSVNPRRYLPPLMLLLGAGILLYASTFPYLHYQVYLAWAALLALPFAVRIVSESVTWGASGAFALCCVTAVSLLLAFQSFRFPYPLLKDYAAMIETAQQVIGSEPVGFVGGTLVSTNSVWPQDPINGYRYHQDYVVEHRWDMKHILLRTGAKFVFDDRGLIKDQALEADRVFIGLNYRETPALPLLIASRWNWIDPGREAFSVESGGPYRTWVFGGGDSARIDGRAAGGGATLQLESGAHRVESAAASVVFTEFATPAVSSSEYRDVIGAKRSTFKYIDADFSGRFRLLGILRLENDEADVYRVFWQSTGTSHADLLAFHHFTDAAGNFVHGENVDPGGGWYSLRELDAGQVFSYRFRVAKSLGARRLNIGLYHRDEIARRVPCGRETYYTLDLATL